MQYKNPPRERVFYYPLFARVWQNPLATASPERPQRDPRRFEDMLAIVGENVPFAPSVDHHADHCRAIAESTQEVKENAGFHLHVLDLQIRAAAVHFLERIQEVRIGRND